MILCWRKYKEQARCYFSLQKYSKKDLQLVERFIDWIVALVSLILADEGKTVDVAGILSVSFEFLMLADEGKTLEIVDSWLVVDCWVTFELVENKLETTNGVKSEVVWDGPIVTVLLDIIKDELGTTDGTESEVVGDWSIVTVLLDIAEDGLGTTDGTEDEVVVNR